jgi:hypothetical protein
LDLLARLMAVLVMVWRLRLREDTWFAMELRSLFFTRRGCRREIGMLEEADAAAVQRLLCSFDFRGLGRELQPLEAEGQRFVR